MYLTQIMVIQIHNDVCQLTKEVNTSSENTKHVFHVGIKSAMESFHMKGLTSTHSGPQGEE
jgi:thiamine biosynthesis lipoprotein ApbE